MKKSEKDQKSKKGKQRQTPAKSTEADAPPPTEVKAPSKLDRRHFDSLIAKLDVSSMHEDDITALLLHCADVLNGRRGATDLALLKPKTYEGCCWERAGDDPVVSIYRRNPRKFLQFMADEDEATRNGIPSC